MASLQHKSTWDKITIINNLDSIFKVHTFPKAKLHFKEVKFDSMDPKLFAQTLLQMKNYFDNNNLIMNRTNFTTMSPKINKFFTKM
jgi:hypothetical protein